MLVIFSVAGYLGFYKNLFNIKNLSGSISKSENIRIGKTMPAYKSKIIVASWNVNNLFDTEDDPSKNDSEYLPPKWTKEKLDKKLSEIANVIKDISTNGPDILAMQEVENIDILNYLIDNYLKNMNYQSSILFEGSDPRGIDVCLISKYPVIKYIQHNQTRGSRGILEVVINVYGNDLGVFVVHHKSRLGGDKETANKRIEQTEILDNIVSKSIANDKLSEILITGDFNDEPTDKSLKTLDNIDGIPFYNLMQYYTSINSNDVGTCYYSKKKTWEIFDQMIVSCNLAEHLCNKPPKGLTFEGNYANIYKGKALDKIKKKDHRPIWIEISVINHQSSI